MSWITARIRITPAIDGKKVCSDRAHDFVDQIRQDALYGTYAELDPAFWQSRMDRKPEELSETEMLGSVPAADGLVSYDFKLRLASDLFSPEMGGAQHLFGILAGDLMRFNLPPIVLKSAQVLELEFPNEWTDAHLKAFRTGVANDVASIRSSFRLGKERPLLAFSFKPRVGFKFEDLRAIAFDVLKNGFNVVELDTRYLPADDKAMMSLVELAAEIASRHFPHVARLSLNLSMPGDLAQKYALALCQSCPEPVIVKVDGGFNGLSSIQTLRRTRVQDGRKLGPVVSCYPLLQNTISNFVPADQYIEALAYSGIDIIYPGRRPDIGTMVRPIDGSGIENVRGAIERYRRLSSKGWPMLSVAGGIYPGQLQAFYELLGPNVAWYLGGAVALHKDGPGAGAALCAKIANKSIELRAKAGKDWAADLDWKLAEECDEMFKGRSSLTEEALRYVSPQQHLATKNGLKPYQL